MTEKSRMPDAPDMLKSQPKPDGAVSVRKDG